MWDVILATVSQSVILIYPNEPTYPTVQSVYVLSPSAVTARAYKAASYTPSQRPGSVLRVKSEGGGFNG